MKNKIEKLAYLTIDDAPVENIESKLDFLKIYNIKAIWFCTGESIKKYPHEAVKILEQGHIIGNHSMSHANFAELSIEKAKEEILSTDKLIESVYKQAGMQRKAKYFRFPYLNNGDNEDFTKTDWNNTHVAAIQKILQEAGYNQKGINAINHFWYKESGLDKAFSVSCTYDTFDWQIGNKSYEHSSLKDVLAAMTDKKSIQSRTLGDMQTREIIMMHAWTKDPDFKKILESLMAMGIKFVFPDL
ncbi:polysaccharide deacetylase family protein [Spirochaetia bacterium 38H-sp]|uniref:Polysaccharide deacetylase family protein n=1 Tax=Rarispira pelagica TaxID=3141764 RepID=A0ABU9UEC8_9SPIR